MGGRVHSVDVAKGVLIALVVFGHVLEAVGAWTDPALYWVVAGIYTFHMPGFVFLTGVTAKTSNLLVRVARLLVLLLVFQVAYTVPLKLVTGSYPVGILDPFWLLWFLLSMACWTLLLPLVQRAPHFWLVGSVAVGLLAGMVPWVGYPLGLSRTLVFFPFFIAGHLWGARLFRWAAGVPSRWKMAAGATLVVVVAMVASSHLTPGWFFGSLGYTPLGVDPTQGIATRAMLLGGATLATFLLVVAVPNRESRTSRVGATSLAVFLLHGFVIVLFQTELAAFAGMDWWVLLGAAVVLSVALVAVFSHPLFDRVVRAVTEVLISPVRRVTAR